MPVFLAAQALLVLAPSITERIAERVPQPPDFAHFPSAIGTWKIAWEDGIDPSVAKVLNADGIVSRTYSETPAVQLSSGGRTAGLFVAWFASQGPGNKQPHSPQVCLPAAGWAPEISDVVTLSTTAGSIAVNRYVAANRTQRAVILYWYQSPRRVIAHEWAAKLWLLPDALRDHRSDTALVRVTVFSQEGRDELANIAARDFAQSLYPILRNTLPR